MGFLAASPGSPSGKEDGLVGGDEAALKKSILPEGNRKKDRRESLPSRSIRNGNRLLAIAGDLRCREARHCRLTERRPPVLCRLRHFDRLRCPIAIPSHARFIKRGDLFATRRRSL